VPSDAFTCIGYRSRVGQGHVLWGMHRQPNMKLRVPLIQVRVHAEWAAAKRVEREGYELAVIRCAFRAASIQCRECSIFPTTKRRLREVFLWTTF